MKNIVRESVLPLFVTVAVLLVLAPFDGSTVAQPSSIRVSDAGLVEGNAGARTVEVSVFVSPPASAPFSVSYTTRDGSAGAADYRPASGTLNFAKTESMKKISITVIGETAIEADERFEVVLSGAPGLAITRAAASVTIVNDDARPGPPTAGTRPGLSTYEVRFTFSGHTGSLGSAPGCPVRRGGKIVMSGLLTGNERVGDADDIVYTGQLQFDADVDMCEGKGEGDDAKLCSIATRGSGPVKVELTVNFDNRGAYIKANKAPGFESSVSGDCDSQQVNEERGMYPDKSMAMIFNGLDLPLETTKLRVGTYTTDLQPGLVTVEVIRQVG
ncbi:MAG TPA: Calx-beta domain-containing protein [Pyrinomonadaceae bacterium]|nr:Calx-beta domain-containing protein [Pyrinomonadaceae bacterium]